MKTAAFVSDRGKNKIGHDLLTCCQLYEQNDSQKTHLVDSYCELSAILLSYQ